jgi:hypothetical protein
MARDQADVQAPGFTPDTLDLARDLDEATTVLSSRPAGCARLEARCGASSLWMIVRMASGANIALRTAHGAGRLTAKAISSADALASFEASSPEAKFRIVAEIKGDQLLRVRTWLTPRKPMLVPFWPRDLYPLGPGDDPTTAKGEVIAAQRGFNAPVVFFRMQPSDAAILYFQNLTALNPWFEATDTRPDTCVGGQWPELGYQPPAAPNAPSPPDRPLAAGVEILLSDVFLALRPETAKGQVAEASRFLEGLAAIYPHLERPDTEFRDWPQMARRTLRGLARSPKASARRYGHLYVRPYTAAEVPDSMVQLAVLLPVMDFASWRGRPSPLARDLRAGVAKFFDPKLGLIRRYLPNVLAGTEPLAKDKDANEVDSWYLYHPLANVGRLALDGDKEARELFLGSLDYAIKVARHFEYCWPVLFDVVSLKAKVSARKPGSPGQSDVGGLYAYVMLQAHALTGDDGFVREAQKAIRATQGLGFELLYQTNITAWSIVACLKLWRLTGEALYRDQSYMFLAGFFHNTVFWESNIGGAKSYQTFLGATCLHDGPYMAPYECFESFAAFREYLDLAGADAPGSLALLLNEYCRYALTRAWSFYPSELPADLPAKESRNGHIDRRLAFPLEDIYADGGPPGQVGQEIYGAGAAFVFTTRTFCRSRSAPITVFCDYPIKDSTFTAKGWTGRIEGWPKGSCRLRLIASDPSKAPRLKVLIGGAAVRLRRVQPGVWEAIAPGRGAIEISWGDRP